MIDLAHYKTLRDEGLSPEELWQLLGEDVQDFPDKIRIVREIFDLDLLQAKAIMLRAKSTANSLEEHAKTFILPALKELIRQDEANNHAWLND